MIASGRRIADTSLLEFSDGCVIQLAPLPEQDSLHSTRLGSKLKTPCKKSAAQARPSSLASCRYKYKSKSEEIFIKPATANQKRLSVCSSHLYLAAWP